MVVIPLSLSPEVTVITLLSMHCSFKLEHFVTSLTGTDCTYYDVCAGLHLGIMNA